MTTYKEEFTTSGTWTVPTGVEWISLLLVGGGGAGDSNDGGGGGECKFLPRVKVSPNDIVNVYIGGGGTYSGGNGTRSYFYNTTSGKLIEAQPGMGASSGGKGGGAGGGSYLTDVMDSSNKNWNIKNGICYGGGGGGSSASSGGDCTSIGAIDGRGGVGYESGGGSYGRGANAGASASANTGAGGGSGGNGGSGYCVIYWNI